jgi:hypothetical protein
MSLLRSYGLEVEENMRGNTSQFLVFIGRGNGKRVILNTNEKNQVRRVFA